MGADHTRGRTIANHFSALGRHLRFLADTEGTWVGEVSASQHARIVKDQELAIDCVSIWNHGADIPVKP